MVNHREFLISPIAHLPPAKILDGLSVEAAERRSPDGPHSIADIVAHLAFWQDWFYDRCVGRATPMVASSAFPQMQERFLIRLQQLGEIGEGAADALVHVATHNSHHLGQVVLLRQLHGAWPPPAGSWTW